MFELLQRNKQRSIEGKAAALAEALSAVAFGSGRRDELDESAVLSEQVCAGIQRVVAAFASTSEQAAIAARTQALLRQRIQASRAAASKAAQAARDAEQAVRDAEAKRLQQRANVLVEKHGSILEGELQEWERAPNDVELCRVWSLTGEPKPSDQFPEPTERQLQEMGSQVRVRLAREHSVRCDDATIKMALKMLQERRLAAQKNMSIEALKAAKAAALREERG